jgi:hypothetical protein
MDRGIPAENPFGAALPYTAAAAATAALTSASGFDLPLRIGVPLVLVVVASKRASDASTRRTHLRMLADDWLAQASSPNPEAFAWRVQELLGAERKAIARALRSYGEEIERPSRPGSPRLNRRGLRPDANLLVAVADALNDDRLASPRARWCVHASSSPTLAARCTAPRVTTSYAETSKRSSRMRDAQTG